MNAFLTYLALDFIVTGLFLIVAYKRRFLIRFYVRKFLGVDSIENRVDDLGYLASEHNRRIRTVAKRIGKLKRKVLGPVAYKDINKFGNFGN